MLCRDYVAFGGLGAELEAPPPDSRLQSGQSVLFVATPVRKLFPHRLQTNQYGLCAFAETSWGPGPSFLSQSHLAASLGFA